MQDRRGSRSNKSYRCMIISSRLAILFFSLTLHNVSFPFTSQGLYLGSFGAASNKSALKSLNITHILTVANSLPPLHPNDFVYKIVSSMIFHLILFLLPYLALFVSVAGARASEVGYSPFFQEK